MSKWRIQRHKHYVAWQMGQQPDFPYPAEAAMMERLAATGNRLFVPYPFPYTDDDTYHYHLAFLVEAVDLLPLKMDLSFDAVWRAFESMYTRSIAPKKYKLHEQAPIVASDIVAHVVLDQAVRDLLSSVPMQSCEYLAQRIFDGWRDPLTDWERIWNRLNNRRHGHVTHLLEEIAIKYSAPVIALDDRRKVAILLRLALHGEEVDLQGAKIKIPVEERISFLLNALLYTFRNDRFHGGMQPPFKSSKGTLRTYTHAHYCFLWAHFLFLYALAKVQAAVVELHLLADNIGHNLEVYKKIYGKKIAP
jgi:hypothetical protein